MTAADFILRYYGDALEAEKQTGVPALASLTQAGLESRWGNSAPGNNFFGIKAGSSWKGDVQKLKTWECGKTGNPKADGVYDELIATYKPGDVNGNSNCNAKGLYSYRVYGKFRAYGTPADSFADHAIFLKSKKAFAPAFKFTDADNFLRAVAQGGYATAPNYESVLINTLNQLQSIVATNPNILTVASKITPTVSRIEKQVKKKRFYLLAA